jgi:hypothetical protein
MVYGDALSTWHEVEAQHYLKEKYPGMELRFITPVGSSRVGVTAKHLGPPGNSPENCALDCHLFSDLEGGMSLNLSLASAFPYGDPRRIFSQGTPTEVFKLMKETWEHCAPTPERIEEDILNWPRICDKIIEAKGVMVPDINFRSGRRVIRTDGKETAHGNFRKSKARKRDRISTLPWNISSHPGLKEAEVLLCGFSD